MSGTTGSISLAGPDAEFKILCDDDGAGTVAFVRRYTTSPAGTVTVTDTGLDGTTPYTVTGTVAVCTTSDAEPGELTAHGEQDTAWALADHAGTVSVTLVVYAGTVTATTAEGALTVPAGGTLTWSASAGTGGVLAGALDLAGAAGASWHVIWTTRP
ncbi:hypothetical protein [Streptomyces sp. SID11385]|uniref:hypothetical protein n=1 Tax=Streptomyces sp. SID11385 TaxID=2706031 RepID=UPI0013CA8165|nr:hypothetical protein [Streptomyces sp. SID11385]NEA39272.1 hypothetical protein [Streptomyces sp. SID11385]